MQQANQSRLPASNSEYYSNSIFDIFDIFMQILSCLGWLFQHNCKRKEENYLLYETCQNILNSWQSIKVERGREKCEHYINSCINASILNVGFQGGRKREDPYTWDWGQRQNGPARLTEASQLENMRPISESVGYSQNVWGQPHKGDLNSRRNSCVTNCVSNIHCIECCSMLFCTF